MEKLLESIYSGIVNVRDWGIFCERLANELRANSVIILSINQTINAPKHAASYGVSEVVQCLLLKYLPDNDPRINVAQSLPCEPHIFDSTTLINVENNILFSSSSIYQEIFSDNAIEYHLILCIPIDKYEDVFIIVDRKAGEEAFTVDDKQVLDNIKDHIVRAVRIQKKYDSHEKYIRAGLNSLKQQPVGSIIADSHSQVFHLNEYAKSIIKQKDGVFIINNHLYHGNLKKHKLFSDVFDLTLNAEQDCLTVISRESTAKPYQIKITPFCTRQTPFQTRHQSENMVQIFIIDPDRALKITTALLENIFGLTASEARVASSLSQNCNLKATQGELNISANTARTHLKSIFSKMNVTSQVELVKLITTSYLWSYEE